jgi:cytochrome c peroxidase
LRVRPLFVRFAVVAAVSTLSACGGGGGSSTSLPSTSAVTATPAPGAVATATPSPAGGLSAAAAAYLNLDISAPLNYAQPALPVFYDAAVRADDNTPADNPVSDRTATLGRVLFHDKRLSVTGAISCASCHQQALGMTDSAQFSSGIQANAFTTAHAMRLGNVRYYRPGTMFWDKRAATVEAQAIVPIQNSVEMGFDAAHGGMAAETSAMAALPYYPELFRFAFGDSTITTARIQAALAQYERSAVTTGSRWDVGYASVYSATAPNKNLDVDLPNFSAEENRGRHLFMAGRNQGGLGCVACHQAPTFALDGNSRSNGLDAGETRIFKAPSLKNDSRGPYMHDGRFATLAEVVDHYDHGIANGPALDPRLQQNGSPQRLGLSAADRAALIAFLETLDDPAFFVDPRFSDPFKK